MANSVSKAYNNLIIRLVITALFLILRLTSIIALFWVQFSRY